MLSRLAGRMKHRHDDSGISLIELVVSMVLMAILGLVTARLFITVDSSSRSSTDRAINAASAGAVTLAWSNYLRVADGTTAGSTSNRIEWLTATDMLFYADLSNRSVTGSGVNTTGTPTMMWLRLDTNKVLIEEQFASNAAVGAVPTACRRLLGNVTAAQLFTASDSTGNPMTSQDLGSAPTPSAGCQNLPVTVPSRQSKPDATAAANLPNVASVGIDFTVADTQNQHSIEFSSVGTLPLLGGSL